jgi:hypothetical protein
VREPLAQRFAVEEFHDGERDAVFVPASCSARMFGCDSAARLRFAIESRESFGIARDRLRQDLDGDFAVETRIARAIDLAHPARAQGLMIS